MDVLDITDEKFAEALKASLLDAGIDYLLDVDGEASLVDIEGYIDLHKVAQHFRRRITAEPIEVEG